MVADRLLRGMLALLAFALLAGCLSVTLPPAPSLSRVSPVGLSTDVRTLATFHFSTPYDFVPGQKLHPLAWSQDSTGLAYTLDDSVWLLQPPNFTAKQIVNIPSSHLGEVVWSPNGENIAIGGVQFQEQVERPFIWEVQGDGTELKDLTTKMEDASREKFINSWVDSQTFSFTFWRGSGIQSLYTVDITNGDTRPLIDLQDNVDIQAIGGEYYWSPDHQYIVTQGCCGGLFVTALSSLNVRERLPGSSAPPYQAFQAWMPGGKQFLYTEPRGTESDLWSWDISQWRGQKLFDNVLKAVPSPDGAFVALIQPENQTWQPTIQNQPSLLPQEPLPTLRLNILDVRSGKIQDMGNVGYSPQESSLNTQYWGAALPVWSPDSKFLAYWDERADVWLTSRDGQWHQPLTHGLQIVEVLWSPDGNELALRSFEQAWIIDKPE